MGNLVENKKKRGPSTPEGRARALANLRPQVSGEPPHNPRGRPSAGLSIREWINIMQGWTVKEVEAVMTDDSAPIIKKTAARALIDSATKDRNSAGMPVAAGDFDRIFDRTAGKPTQPVEHTGTDGNAIKVSHTYNLKALPPDDLRQLRETLAKAAAAMDN